MRNLLFQRRGPLQKAFLVVLFFSVLYLWITCRHDKADLERPYVEGRATSFSRLKDVSFQAKKPATPPSKTKYTALEAMRERAKHIQERCRQYARSPGNEKNSTISQTFCPKEPDVLSKTLVTMRDNSLLFTPLPKCGWSTWIQLMYLHAKVDNSKRKGYGWAAPFNLLGWKISYLNCVADFSKYTERLLFVRNPYDRLVSAYKEKVTMESGNYVKRFRTPCRWLTLAPKYNSTILTFKRFVGCIIDNANSLVEFPSTIDSSSRSIGIQLDQHWAPQVHLSLPCSINYTLIGKKEHFADDVTAAMKLLHINGTVVHSNKSPDHLSKELSYWYKQLDSEVISQLQELYKYDFEIFGYDPAPPLQ